ncbi:elongation factor P [Candidatus Profftella armatura]|uniref:elongation factor P n=1 Tax=Candidatus Profftella armatura TaxID=669502 RepID=UPI003D96F413
MKLVKEVRVGNVILFQNKLMIVLRSDFHGSSRNGFTYKWKMKNILTNKLTENIFRGDEKINVIFLKKKPMTYLYFSNPFYIFIDKNYEQYELKIENIKNILKYLKNDMECEAILYQKKIITIELPDTIIRKVIYSESAVRGNTSKNVLKKIKIENAIKKYCYVILAPLFVHKNDLIEIDTRTNEYKKIIRN